MSRATSRRRKSSTPIRLAISTSASPRCAPNKENSTCFAIDQTFKFAFVELHEKATTAVSGGFLRNLLKAVTYKVHTVLTDDGIQFSRTIKDATVKRFYYENHDQLRLHLADFVSAYNFGRRLKTLKGLTPFEFICKCWTEPDRFIYDPTHQFPGLNN